MIVIVSVFMVLLQEEPITEDFREEFNNKYMQLGGLGERVLG